MSLLHSRATAVGKLWKARPVSRSIHHALMLSLTIDTSLDRFSSPLSNKQLDEAHAATTCPLGLIKIRMASLLINPETSSSRFECSAWEHPVVTELAKYVLQTPTGCDCQGLPFSCWRVISTCGVWTRFMRYWAVIMKPMATAQCMKVHELIVRSSSLVWTL